MNETRSEEPMADVPLDQLCINTVRTLAMDAVQKANSGHPGTPMALAPAGYVLWDRFLKHNPGNPGWFDRDRFVLSAGHASMLLYALLHLTGYDLPLTQLQQFRQWGSRTPGHPEHGLTSGVETTTGPLGQGFMNAVGMAIAEAHLAGVFNRADHRIVDHRTWVFASDGDMMEGASHEAASLAGHLGLGKLIVLYDDNHISIDGSTEITYSDDVVRRFEGYHWHVQNLGENANNLDALAGAFESARGEEARPSLIVLRSHIAEGAPHAHDTAAAHGSPLGEEEVRLAKRNYGWPEDARFFVPERARTHMMEAIKRGAASELLWDEKMETYRRKHPELAARFQQAISGDLPTEWDVGLPAFEAADGLIATRLAAGKALNAIANKVPWLVGGAADLASSTKAAIDRGGDFERESHGGRNVHWGVREHVMCGAANGMALHRGVRPFASSFLIFTDYARPAIRLAALMRLPVIYVMTHDSVGLGEDGPTHQPIEQLASLRAMPNMTVIRPADATETVGAWRAVMTRMNGPTVLVLTRQKLPIVTGAAKAVHTGVEKGAYVVSPERERPEAILIASGSELRLVLDAQERLFSSHGIDARVVSMPSWEMFREQGSGYRDRVLPPTVSARLAVEAGATQGWMEWVGCKGDVLGIDHFGASAPGPTLFENFGFTTDAVVDRMVSLVGSAG